MSTCVNNNNNLRVTGESIARFTYMKKALVLVTYFEGTVGLTEKHLNFVVSR